MFRLGGLPKTARAVADAFAAALSPVLGAACHATVERLQQLDRYLPPLRLLLWREQHPEAEASQWHFELGGIMA